MWCGTQDCKGCDCADPAKDTVKVNMKNLPRSPEKMPDLAAPAVVQKIAGPMAVIVPGKENVCPTEPDGEPYTKKKGEHQARYQALQQEQVKIALKQAEEDWKQQELERQNEKQVKQEREHVAAKATKSVELEESGELYRKQATALKVIDRIAQDLQHRNIVEGRARQKVDEFLKQRGFANVNGKRRKMLKASYPLHVAVTEKDPEMVRLLLWAGADPTKKDTLGKTPLYLAEHPPSKGATKRSELLSAFTEKQVDIMKSPEKFPSLCMN